MSMQPVTVVVLAGGPDAEREVSLNSGRAVYNAIIASNRFSDVRYLEIDTLTSGEIAAIDADVFVPILHGPYGEGGPLQILLEIDGRPFVGSGSHAASIAMDKLRTSQIASELGIPVPRAILWDDFNQSCPIEPPVVIKPVADGSSVGVFICHTLEKLEIVRQALLMQRLGSPAQFHQRIMVEQYIPGRELTVGIVDGRAEPVIEIIPAVSYYDFDAKYDRDDTQYVIDPELGDDLTNTLQNASVAIFEKLGCKDMARIDFRYDSRDESPNGFGDSGCDWGFLEINTIPGFTEHSLLPMGSIAAGRSMPELCALLVDCALARGRTIADNHVDGDNA